MELKLILTKEGYEIKVTILKTKVVKKRNFFDFNNWNFYFIAALLVKICFQFFSLTLGT